MEKARAAAVEKKVHKKMKKALILFYKYPQQGKVKTRLAKSLGDKNAFEVYKGLLADLFVNTESVPADKIIACSIDDNTKYRDLGFGYDYFIQKGTDLGSKMYNAFEVVFSKNYNRAVLIGSDCPEIRSNLLEEAFEALKKNEYVLGPSSDGGYYLIGMRKEVLNFTIFRNIPWSTSDVLNLTLNQIKKNNSSIELLKELNDIDDIHDLRIFYELYHSDRDSHTINYLTSIREEFYE